MPLDSTTLSLADALALEGIRGVPEAVLVAHKAEQVRKNPGSFWYSRILLLRNLVVGGFISGALTGLVCMAGAVAALASGERHAVAWLLATGAGLCVAALVLHCAFPVTKQFKGPAHWVERRLFSVGSLTFINVPDAVVRLARSARLAGTTIVIGELIQDHVVLDPYLLLVRGDERVCLAIWDGVTVLHIAETGMETHHA